MASFYHSNLLGFERGRLHTESVWCMIISTSLMFRFAEGKLVVINSLPSEPMTCLQSLFEHFQMGEVTGGQIQYPSDFNQQWKGFLTFSFLKGETRSHIAKWVQVRRYSLCFLFAVVVMGTTGKCYKDLIYSLMYSKKKKVHNFRGEVKR